MSRNSGLSAGTGIPVIPTFTPELSSPTPTPRLFHLPPIPIPISYHHSTLTALFGAISRLYATNSVLPAVVGSLVREGQQQQHHPQHPQQHRNDLHNIPPPPRPKLLPHDIRLNGPGFALQSDLTASIEMGAASRLNIDAQTQDKIMTSPTTLSHSSIGSLFTHSQYLIKISSCADVIERQRPRATQHIAMWYVNLFLFPDHHYSDVLSRYGVPDPTPLLPYNSSHINMEKDSNQGINRPGLGYVHLFDDPSSNPPTTLTTHHTHNHNQPRYTQPDQYGNQYRGGSVPFYNPLKNNSTTPLGEILLQKAKSTNYLVTFFLSQAFTHIIALIYTSSMCNTPLELILNEIDGVGDGNGMGRSRHNSTLLSSTGSGSTGGIGALVNANMKNNHGGRSQHDHAHNTHDTHNNTITSPNNMSHSSSNNRMSSTLNHGVPMNATNSNSSRRVALYDGTNIYQIPFHHQSTLASPHSSHFLGLVLSSTLILPTYWCPQPVIHPNTTLNRPLLPLFPPGSKQSTLRPKAGPQIPGHLGQYSNMINPPNNNNPTNNLNTNPDHHSPSPFHPHSFTPQQQQQHLNHPHSFNSNNNQRVIQVPGSHQPGQPIFIQKMTQGIGVQGMVGDSQHFVSIPLHLHSLFSRSPPIYAPLTPPSPQSCPNPTRNPIVYGSAMGQPIERELLGANGGIIGQIVFSTEFSPHQKVRSWDFLRHKHLDLIQKYPFLSNEWRGFEHKMRGNNTRNNNNNNNTHNINNHHNNKNIQNNQNNQNNTTPMSSPPTTLYPSINTFTHTQHSLQSYKQQSTEVVLKEHLHTLGLTTPLPPALHPSQLGFYFICTCSICTFTNKSKPNLPFSPTMEQLGYIYDRVQHQLILIDRISSTLVSNPSSNQSHLPPTQSSNPPHTTHPTHPTTSTSTAVVAPVIGPNGLYALPRAGSLPPHLPMASPATATEPGAFHNPLNLTSNDYHRVNSTNSPRHLDDGSVLQTGHSTITKGIRLGERNGFGSSLQDILFESLRHDQAVHTSQLCILSIPMALSSPAILERFTTRANLGRDLRMFDITIPARFANFSAKGKRGSKSNGQVSKSPPTQSLQNPFPPPQITHQSPPMTAAERYNSTAHQAALLYASTLVDGSNGRTTCDSKRQPNSLASPDTTTPSTTTTPQSTSSRLPNQYLGYDGGAARGRKKSGFSTPRRQVDAVDAVNISSHADIIFAALLDDYDIPTIITPDEYIQQHRLQDTMRKQVVVGDDSLNSNNTPPQILHSPSFDTPQIHSENQYASYHSPSGLTPRLQPQQQPQQQQQQPQHGGFWGPSQHNTNPNPNNNNNNTSHHSPSHPSSPSLLPPHGQQASSSRPGLPWVPTSHNPNQQQQPNLFEAHQQRKQQAGGQGQGQGQSYQHRNQGFGFPQQPQQQQQSQQKQQHFLHNQIPESSPMMIPTGGNSSPIDIQLHSTPNQAIFYNNSLTSQQQQQQQQLYRQPQSVPMRPAFSGSSSPGNPTNFNLHSYRPSSYGSTSNNNNSTTTSHNQNMANPTNMMLFSPQKQQRLQDEFENQPVQARTPSGGGVGSGDYPTFLAQARSGSSHTNPRQPSYSPRPSVTQQQQDMIVRFKKSIYCLVLPPPSSHNYHSSHSHHSLSDHRPVYERRLTSMPSDYGINGYYNTHRQSDFAEHEYPLIEVQKNTLRIEAVIHFVLLYNNDILKRIQATYLDGVMETLARRAVEQYKVNLYHFAQRSKAMVDLIAQQAHRQQQQQQLSLAHDDYDGGDYGQVEQQQQQQQELLFAQASHQLFSQHHARQLSIAFPTPTQLSDLFKSLSPFQSRESHELATRVGETGQQYQDRQHQQRQGNDNRGGGLFSWLF